jgi:hypothetical protein
VGPRPGEDAFEPGLDGVVVVHPAAAATITHPTGTAALHILSISIRPSPIHERPLRAEVALRTQRSSVKTYLRVFAKHNLELTFFLFVALCRRPTK